MNNPPTGTESIPSEAGRIRVLRKGAQYVVNQPAKMLEDPSLVLSLAPVLESYMKDVPLGPPGRGGR